MFDTMEIYVVEGEKLGSIMGYPTASRLSVIKVIDQVHATVTGRGNLEDDFEHIFNRIDKLKNRQIKLHIGKDVPTVVQRPRKNIIPPQWKVKTELAG